MTLGTHTPNKNLEYTNFENFKNENPEEVQKFWGKDGLGIADLAVPIRKISTKKYAYYDENRLDALDPRKFEELICEILQFPAEERTDDMVRILMFKFGEMEFFTRYIESGHRPICLEICRHLKLSKYSNSEIVFRKGDKPDLFYLILKGDVAIWTPKPPKILFQEITESREQNSLLTKKEKRDLCRTANENKTNMILPGTFKGCKMYRYLEDPAIFDTDAGIPR
jgi:hypothetical protein